MTTRLRIHHRSQYTYDKPVIASFNEVRLSPLAAPWQSPLESVLRVDEASWQYQYTDYWGTQVRVFEAQNAHRDLVVESSSLVEVDQRRMPQPRWDLGWDGVRNDTVADNYGEYLSQTASTEPPEDLLGLAEEHAADTTPHEAALAVCAAIHESMSYLPGSTGVHTVAAEAWLSRSGVCQDYAHLAVGALRYLGIPARYVSGYLHPKKDAEIGEPATGESHAWVEWWLGEWAGYDPTNNAAVAERHVVVGRGRDYNDVPPIKGIVAGSATSRLQVSVEITRLA